MMLARQYCRTHLLLLSLLFISVGLATAPTTKAQPATPAIKVAFVGATSLEELMQGAPGDGTLLYYGERNAPDYPSLVVKLHKQPGATTAVAEVYDAGTTGSLVPVQVQNNSVTVDPAYKPVLTIVAQNGWWVRDGITNYNLDVTVRGQVYAMWSAETYLQWVDPGEQLATIQTRMDAAGVPRWDLRQLTPPLEGKGVLRTNYAERTCPSPITRDPSISPAWPYIAVSGEYKQTYGHLQPPIVVDWANGRIKYFSEIVPVRQQNCSYALYTLDNLQPGKLNRTNFEAPFAFYDLSGAGIGIPNLVIRTERFPANDAWSSGINQQVQKGRPAPRDVQWIRYSWRDAVGDGQWDRKIEVLGFQPYTDQTPIADGALSVDAPSYQDMPTWVVDKAWPVVTFVDTEGTPYASDEGIYEWSPLDIGVDYLFGWNEQPSAPVYPRIRERLRGEYRFRQDLPPMLYISPIDNRLHLLGAEGGVWNVGDGWLVRARNIGNSLYLNAWTRERAASGRSAELGDSSQIAEALYALQGHLLYVGEQGVEIRQVAYKPSTLELAPPTDTASWQAFQDRVQPLLAQKRSPDNLRGWLNAFAGPQQTIKNARISNVTATANGFEFVLRLDQTEASTDQPLLDLRGLLPGDYLVTYDGTFNVKPLTPPAVSATLDTPSLTQLETGALPLTLRNNGAQDIPKSRLEVWATSPQGQETLIAVDTVSVSTQTQVRPKIEWTPPAAGTWILTPKIQQINGRNTILPALQVAVQPAQAVPADLMLAKSTSPLTLPFIIACIAAFALLGALAFGRQWRTLPTPPTDDVP